VEILNDLGEDFDFKYDWLDNESDSPFNVYKEKMNLNLNFSNKNNNKS
jgi:hypothetical protein